VSGEPQRIKTKNLAALLEAATEDGYGLRLVALNACYSAVAAQYVVDKVDTVITMQDLADNGATIEFTRAFYNELASQEEVTIDFNKAFNIASRIVKCQYKDEDLTPKIFFRTSDA